MTRLPAIAMLLLSAACAVAPAPAPLSGDPTVDVFAREVEAELESHAWQRLLARADPDHFRTQVREHGMPEPQYLAELFGLHMVDNNIRRGERVEWSDLERIRTVELTEISPAGEEHRLTGVVTLEDGTTFDLDASIAVIGGRPVLTGGVG